MDVVFGDGAAATTLIRMRDRPHVLVVDIVLARAAPETIRGLNAPVPGRKMPVARPCRG
jgi:hypothetical protein